MDQLNGEDVQTQSDYNSWSQVKGTGWKDYTGSVPSINFETEFPGAGFSQRDFKLYSCQVRPRKAPSKIEARNRRLTRALPVPSALDAR